MALAHEIAVDKDFTLQKLRSVNKHHPSYLYDKKHWLEKRYSSCCSCILSQTSVFFFNTVSGRQLYLVPVSGTDTESKNVPEHWSEHRVLYLQDLIVSFFLCTALRVGWSGRWRRSCTRHSGRYSGRSWTQTHHSSSRWVLPKAFWEIIREELDSDPPQFKQIIPA